jgi:hypothetical protein
MIFVADAFANQILGGGELNNDEFIRLISDDHQIKQINSHLVTESFLNENRAAKFIIANFANLSPEAKEYIKKNLNYVIYEHDHKYLANRNPAIFDNFIAPKNKIINFEFYEKAKSVFCQSSFHCGIVKKNLNLTNIINLSGNLWSDESLDMIEQHSLKNKKDACSIMDSPIPHKNTKDAVLFCKLKKFNYELIKSDSYSVFLNNLSNNDKLVFFPKTPETLSRIVVEAKMMGMTTITNKTIGAVGEEWFSLKGKDLIEHMRKKKMDIIKLVLGAF